MTTSAMFGNANNRISFGKLPRSPDSARFEAKADEAVPRSMLEASNA